MALLADLVLAIQELPPRRSQVPSRLALPEVLFAHTLRHVQSFLESGRLNVILHLTQEALAVGLEQCRLTLRNVSGKWYRA